jgi:hypothetical protein
MREDLDANASNEPNALSPLAQLTILAMQRGTFEKTRDSDDTSDDDEPGDGPRNNALVVTHLGFNLHAGVTIAANDDTRKHPPSDRRVRVVGRLDRRSR